MASTPEQQREWKRKNPDKYTANWKRYNAKNKERIYARNRMRYVDRKHIYAITRNAKRAFIIAEKSRPCLDCTRMYPWYVMDFDHVRGVKRYNISKMAASYSWKAIMDELIKCDLVCSNCHRERTFNNR